MSQLNCQDRGEELIALVDSVPSEKAKNYIKVRLIPQRNWYAQKSRDAKKQYQAWMIGSIVLSTMIPVFALIADSSIYVRLLITALSSGVSFINAYLLLKNSKGQWLTYRSTGDALLRALYLYLAEAGIFSECSTPNDRDVLLVQTCEDIMAKESSDWLVSLDQS